MTYTVLFLYSLPCVCLALSSEAHEAFDEATLEPLLERFEVRVWARRYDAEAFTACYSDFALFEAGDLKDLCFFLAFQAMQGAER